MFCWTTLYRVCDNVDLGLVLADFVNFYHVR